MQGTVWGGLKCTSTMVQLCQQILKHESIMYKYKGEVPVPPLEMLDDVISVVECGSKSVRLNAIVNAFMETKKLKLSADKCSRIHTGNKASIKICPEHKVHQ